jgi:tRNA A37 threonylcarbamoyladenosine dehydratase
MVHEFSRTEALLGTTAMERLRASTVAVFGLGGVGSFVVEALARSGIGSFVLVDPDIVSLTNINRQIIALHSTIGRPKAIIMQERILDINPNAVVVARQELVREDTVTQLVTPELSYVVDAIDMVSGKIALVLRSQALGIPILSALGTGNKTDPTKLEIANIYDTSVCPLARILRRELRKKGVSSLTVVYSKEQPIHPVNEVAQDINAGATGILLQKHSIPASCAFVPSVAGLLIASRVVRDLVTI